MFKRALMYAFNTTGCAVRVNRGWINQHSTYFTVEVLDSQGNSISTWPHVLHSQYEINTSVGAIVEQYVPSLKLDDFWDYEKKNEHTLQIS